jgi:hypothetical protein
LLQPGWQGKNWRNTLITALMNPPSAAPNPANEQTDACCLARKMVRMLLLVARRWLSLCQFTRALQNGTWSSYSRSRWQPQAAQSRDAAKDNLHDGEK